MIETLLESLWVNLASVLGALFIVFFTMFSIVYLLLRAGWRSLSRSIDKKVAKFTNKGA
jgi:ABC-type Fe3+ transport system permease subunit